MTVDATARRLLDAQDQRTTLASFDSHLDLETAYAVQDRALELRRARGETVVGVKLGLTARAKQRQMGVDVPIVAWLTDAMVLPAGVAVSLERLIHPRVEPEIAFVMGDRLAGPGVTAARALTAVAAVHGAVEVIDSRYEAFRFTLPDVVADNASAACFAMGPRGRRPDELDLSFEATILEVDGSVVHSAAGAAILGHPAEALAFAANALALRGQVLEPGWIVLAGAMTEAVPITHGSVVHVSYPNLGAITLRAAAPLDNEQEST